MNNDIKNISLNKVSLKLWWFPGLVGAVVVVGTLSLLVPTVQRFLEQNDSLKATHQQLEKLQTALVQTAKLDEVQVGEVAALTYRALPQHKPYYEILMTVQRLAAETGVQTGDFDLDPGSLATLSAAKSTDGSMALSTSLSVNGTTAQVSQFIEQLQTSLPLIEITKIAIDARELHDETDLRQAVFDITIYYSPTVEKKAVVDEVLPTMTDTLSTAVTTLQNYDVQSVADASDSAVIDLNRKNIFAF